MARKQDTAGKSIYESQRLTACTNLQKLKADKSPAGKRASRNQVPPIAKEMLVFGCCSEMKSLFSSIRLTLGISNTIQGRPHTQE